MRLLVATRDTNAGLALLPVIRCAMAVEGVRVLVTAQAPALTALRAGGASVHPVTSPPADPGDPPAVTALLAEADAIIAGFAPDALLTGVSAPAFGIEEALLQRCAPVPGYRLQDFPGTVPADPGRPAPTFLVADEAAAAATRAAGAGRVVVVGETKYDAPATFGGDLGGGTGERRADNVRRIGFYGQPLWHLDGYPRTIEAVARTLSALADVNLLYRPHPGESPGQAAAACAVLQGSGHPVDLDTVAPVERSLATVDVAASCFSSIGRDLAQMNARSAMPLGATVFVLIDPGIRALVASVTGSPLPPAVPAGTALAATAPDELAATFAAALDSAVRDALWRRCRVLHAGTAGAARRALDVILADAGFGIRGGRLVAAG